MESISQHLILFFQVSPKIWFLVHCSSLPFFNNIVFFDSSFATSLLLYADDILLLHPINNPADIFTLNSKLDTISSWLSSKLLHINSSKSKYMYMYLFLHSQSSFEWSPSSC